MALFLISLLVVVCVRLITSSNMKVEAIDPINTPEVEKETESFQGNSIESWQTIPQDRIPKYSEGEMNNDAPKRESALDSDKENCEPNIK